MPEGIESASHAPDPPAKFPSGHSQLPLFVEKDQPF